MEYWDITENPTDDVYRNLINVLCGHSDSFYFVTRKELTYDQDILDQFKPYTSETYKTNEWANTMTKGPAATVYMMESNEKTCELLKRHANTLYDWVAPHLPEDLTFMKNGFAWFSCTTHEEYSGFSIRSDYYKNIMCAIEGLKIQKSE
ncbi:MULTISPECIES: hypothetical protein [unclassified Sporosarcina]|uniref:hypothetical protein n=1 Tax=unclassified Sporosarcina TaxID=2647733 RepID=UPI000C165FA8|nr:MULTISPECIES: hypothetical protein [unclassified Sporosarcina]PID06470.1 hypothetical protein CSV66_04030 [Sporosarcina sp. P30]PID09664.1 hypothetical protein CSV65_04030 [Sporosarcina sp. P31]PID13242.1 hypothetical protein CSV64_02065 [Sporosarcina sp. P32b]